MKLYKENLENVRNYVLEEMAMMMLDPVDEGQNPFTPGEEYYVSQAHYTGVFNGTLTLLCQESFANLLPASLVGSFDGELPSEAERIDALRELTNVISGNLLVDAFGEETVFELPHLSVNRKRDSEVTCFLDEGTVLCLADGAPFALHFAIHPD